MTTAHIFQVVASKRYERLHRIHWDLFDPIQQNNVDAGDSVAPRPFDLAELLDIEEYLEESLAIHQHPLFNSFAHFRWLIHVIRDRGRAQADLRLASIPTRVRNLVHNLRIVRHQKGDRLRALYHQYTDGKEIHDQ